MTQKIFSLEEVRKHNTEKDLWFIYRRKVYNITEFIDLHPGGVETLFGVAGDDGTNDFDAVGHSDSAKVQLEQYLIGELDPADVEKLKPQLQGSQTNPMTMGIIALVLAVLAYFIFRG